MYQMYQKYHLRKGKAGFSLIELLVVISIIAILLAVGAASYTTAQQKARDSTRRGDMRAVQNAFEQYYSVNAGYAGCSSMATAQYLPGGLPSDPKGGSYPASCDGVADTYCVCGLLENETGNSDDSGCSYDSSGNEDYFCVSNQQ